MSEMSAVVQRETAHLKQKINALPIRVLLDEDHPDQIKEKLQTELRKYNSPFLGEYKRKNFAAYITDQNDEIIAGIYGFTVTPYQTLRLEFAWVHEKHRMQGMGSALFKYIEKYARSKECKVIQVSTGRWQGEEFYKKIGYKVIGIIPKWFCYQDEIFFIKELP